jgi:hypothetical protein
MFRARQELYNGALLAKFGIDTAENKPPKVSMKRGGSQTVVAPFMMP